MTKNFVFGPHTKSAAQLFIEQTEKFVLAKLFYVQQFNYLCTMINVRKNLKAIIEERGISQKKIAIEVGMTESALSNWLKDSSLPTLKKTLEICEVIGVPIVDVFTYPEKYVPEDQAHPACEECKRKDEIIDYLTELLRRYKAEAKQKPKKE